MAATKHCPQCGNEFASDALHDLCPKCLAAVSFAPDSTGTVRSVREDSTPLNEKPGARIGRYKLLQKIGEGGCGVVYMAEQEEPVRRPVALKVIKLGMDTKQVIARFEAERQALAMMDHPNIAKVLDAGSTERPLTPSLSPAGGEGWGEGVVNAGRPYFVMELVKGIRITDYCDQNNLPTHERLDLFIKICSAIQHAHQKGIIHRDIKPSNVLVTLHDGVPVPKVIDFGIAKATQGRLTDKTLFTAFEQFIGTPAYMSPEQAEMSGLDIDTRSDIYSLGVLLYELLTGKTPFDAKELVASGIDAMRKTIREQEPAKPSTRLTQELVAASRQSAADSGAENSGALPKRRHGQIEELIRLLRGDLDWIVMKCLEKDRTRRYETANGLAMDIQRHVNNEPITARPPTTAYKFQKLVRRNKLAFTAAALVTATLVLGVVASTWQAVRATRAEREQLRLRQQAQANESKAKSEAAKSRQVAQFLQEMLQGVGPSVALGRDTTMLKEILDKTAERIGNDLQDQPDVEAELRTTIGSVYYELFDLEKAEAMFRKALALRRTFLGQEHPLVPESLYMLGRVLRREGTITGAGALRQSQGSEAKTLFEQALALNRKLLGNENPEVAKCLCELAFIISDEGREAQAEAMIREALAMQKKLLGNVHPDVARSLEALAGLRWGKGELAEAEALWREVLAIHRSLFGDEHPQVARCLGAVADVLNQQGKQAEAEAAWREALAMGDKLQGEEHFFVATTRNNLIKLLRDQGRLADVEGLLRDELARAQKSYGDTSEKLSGPIARLADFLLSQHKFTEAEQISRDVLMPVLVSQPESARLLEARGNIRARTGRWQEAAADFSRMVELEPGDQWTYVRLAFLLVQTGDLGAYHGLCERIKERFGNTADPQAANQVAVAFLILPSPGADLATGSRLTDVAVTAGKGHPNQPNFELTKGLAEYRQGHFASAEDWVARSLAATNSWHEDHVEAYMVLAMTLYQLKQTDRAGAALAKGLDLAQAKLPTIQSGDVGQHWVDWIMARTLMREAQALIGVEPGAGNRQVTEKR